MRRAVAALILLLVLTPASANDATVLVSATILPRNTCSLIAGASGIRCTWSDAKLTYRVNTTASERGFRTAVARRGQVQGVRTGAARVMTIEF